MAHLVELEKQIGRVVSPFGESSLQEVANACDAPRTSPPCPVLEQRSSRAGQMIGDAIQRSAEATQVLERRKLLDLAGVRAVSVFVSRVVFALCPKPGEE